MNYPSQVQLIEVGPRDGLQNESVHLSSEQISTFIDLLSATGLQFIESGAFVSPRWVPQMANTAQVMKLIDRSPRVTYSVLTPNEKGLDAAVDAKVDEVAVFAAVSETFSQKNINASIEHSLQRYAKLTERAKSQDLPIRGYLSCVLGCPYEGSIDPTAVVGPCQSLFEMGCYEVSLGDTIGTGTAGSMSALLDTLLNAGIPAEKLAVHCHDTYGQALANIVIALQYGINRIDTSVAGLGGCPYAKGASGNVATEDVIYLLNGLGIEHNVDLTKLMEAGNYICQQLNKPTLSRVAKALIKQ